MLSEANGNLEFASQTCTFRSGSRVAAMSALEVYEGQSTGMNRNRNGDGLRAWQKWQTYRLRRRRRRRLVVVVEINHELRINLSQNWHFLELKRSHEEYENIVLSRKFY